MPADILYDALAFDDPMAYVRSLIPDMEQLSDPSDPAAAPSYLFDDATLKRFLLYARDNNPKRAAADALLALAGSELLILKEITSADFSTKGSDVAKEHRMRAEDLRADADEDQRADDNSGLLSAPYLKHPLPFNPASPLYGSTFGLNTGYRGW